MNNYTRMRNEIEDLTDESATLRRELAEAQTRADVQHAEYRSMLTMRDEEFRRRQAAESALSEARKESAGLLGRIKTLTADRAEAMRQWAALRDALIGLRYRPEPGEPDRYCDHAAEPCDRCAKVRRALASPRETAPAAAPCACTHEAGDSPCPVHGMDEAAPHNPQSEE